MYKIILFSLTMLIFNGAVYSWAFNNVEYLELMAKISDEAEDFDIEKERAELEQLRFGLIFPGTKWCGAGNVALDYDDLGPSKDSDMCCRDHDNCPEVIPGGETRYNLTNDAFYARLGCECDETFRQCLRKVDSKTSRLIGKVYFNAIGTKCYREDYPIIGCKRKGGWLNLKCIEYELDTNGEQSYQWFDVPKF